LPRRRRSAADLDALLAKRPIVVAIAGSNGAGKSTFFEAFLAGLGLRFVNADDLALGLDIGAYAAARAAAAVRQDLVARRESFVFETVLSDPVGEKVEFLAQAVERGFTVLILFIGLESARLSDERVAMRVSQGGHDVPKDKVAERYDRTLENLRRSIQRLPLVFVYDNSDLGAPYRPLARFQQGKAIWEAARLPRWMKRVLSGGV
jgi:predicted ABC-type ATPase